MNLRVAKIMSEAIFGPVREKSRVHSMGRNLSVPKMGISQMEFSLTCPMIANG
jgi:hypothetical protein